MAFQKELKVVGAYARPAVTKDKHTKKNMNTPTAKKESFFNDLTECVRECSRSSETLIAGDFNAKVLQAGTTEENRVIKSHTVCGARSWEEMGESAKESRRLFITWCLEHDYVLDNTKFPKQVEKLATFRPVACSPAKRIHENTHEQTDYILTRHGNTRITDCETDTHSALMTDHYPIIADMKILFRDRPENPHKLYRYNNKSIWKDEGGQEMNNILHQLIEQNKLNSYPDWVKAYETVVMSFETKENKIWKDYLSNQSRNLLWRKEMALWYGDTEAARELKKEIKKSVNIDKTQWVDKLTNEDLNDIERWENLKDISKEYKPKRYARRDIRDNIVELDDRAEAAK